MRTLLVVCASLAPAALVYSLPVLIQVEMLNWRLDPWILRVAIAELPACALLFCLGLRWSAPLIFFIVAAAEGLALAWGLAPEKGLVFVLNLAPAAWSVVAAGRIALRFAVEREGV